VLEREDRAKATATLRCLGLVLPDEVNQSFRLETTQRVEESYITSLVRFFAAERNSQIWKVVLRLLCRMGAKDDRRVHKTVLQRIKAGDSAAVKVAAWLFPRGHAGALEAVQSMLKIVSEPAAAQEGFRLLDVLAPEVSHKQHIRRMLTGWLDSRDPDFRRMALRMAADIPTDDLQGDEDLMLALGRVAEGDWPQLRQCARGICALVAA